MEDKSINDINNALNSLQKDEEQIKQEIEKLQGKYEFENGKFVEPKEVTQYKKDLERVQKEIEEKTATREQRKLDEEKLTERENNLIEEKANLEDENRIKYLKNLYRNNPEAPYFDTFSINKFFECLEIKANFFVKFFLVFCWRVSLCVIYSNHKNLK